MVGRNWTEVQKMDACPFSIHDSCELIHGRMQSHRRPAVSGCSLEVQGEQLATFAKTFAVSMRTDRAHTGSHHGKRHGNDCQCLEGKALGSEKKERLAFQGIHKASARI